VAEHADYKLQVVSRPTGAKGFVLLPKRWVAERTFAALLDFLWVKIESSAVEVDGSAEAQTAAEASRGVLDPLDLGI
jgi:transposase